MIPPLWVKICGVTSVEQAEMVAAAGASAIGLNFVSTSPRRVSVEQARAIVAAVGPRVDWVGVFADAPLEELLAIRGAVGLSLLQLHGDEPPELLQRLGAEAYKAIRVASAEDTAQADAYGGDRILVDARVEGALGGTGKAFDWQLVCGLAKRRHLVLAGGLRPSNVGAAVQMLKPFGVDTASGVEKIPGIKDPTMTANFVASARAAHRDVAGS